MINTKRIIITLLKLNSIYHIQDINIQLIEVLDLMIDYIHINNRFIIIK